MTDTKLEETPQANYRGNEPSIRLRYTEINQALRRTLTGRVVQRKHLLDEPAVELCSCRSCNRSYLK